jgi:TonB family protein
MACLTAGDFQRMRHERRDDLYAHLGACPKCRAAFERAMTTDRRVDGWLSSLSTPGDELQPDVRTALARLLSGDEMGPVAHTSWYGSPSRYVSVAVHAGFFALLMFASSSPVVQQSIREKFELIDPTLTPYLPKAVQGGGGGGAREAQPVSKGQLPKPSVKAFVPPQIVITEAKLRMEPTIVAPPDVQSAQAPNWGDPLASMLNNSNGSGSGGGMGSGANGGIGPGSGVGLGPGARGGDGGAVYGAGNGVSMPVAVLKVDPEYSEDARKARYSGTVVLSVVIDKDGHPQDIRVLHSLGMGLDEKAIEAVAKWRFKPGMRDGHPVNVRAQIDVNFRLL